LLSGYVFDNLIFLETNNKDFVSELDNFFKLQLQVLNDSRERKINVEARTHESLSDSWGWGKVGKGKKY
jgi:hypothetical protein